MSSSSPLLSLAVWSAARHSGCVGADDVLAALDRWSTDHHVMSAEGEAIGGIGSLLTVVRPVDEVRLVHWVAGDVSQIPAGTTLARALSESGALLDGLLIRSPEGHGRGLTVHRSLSTLSEDPLASTDPGPLLWRVHQLPDELPALSGMGLGEAHFRLRDAMEGATQAVKQVGATNPRASLADTQELVEDLLRGWSVHELPEDVPPRVARVLTSCDHLRAVLLAAGVLADNPQQHPALLPLWLEHGRARTAAVEACVRGLAAS